MTTGRDPAAACDVGVQARIQKVEEMSGADAALQEVYLREMAACAARLAGPEASTFLATDRAEMLPWFSREIGAAGPGGGDGGNAGLWFHESAPRDWQTTSSGGSCAGVVGGLVDMFTLARCERIVVTAPSSFGHVAARLVRGRSPWVVMFTVAGGTRRTWSVPRGSDHRAVSAVCAEQRTHGVPYGEFRHAALLPCSDAFASTERDAAECELGGSCGAGSWCQRRTAPR